jgi:hypothetical protein
MIVVRRWLLTTFLQAFESPMLEDCHSNSSAREMAKVVGSTRIRYGAKGEDALGKTEIRRRLAFAHPDVSEQVTSGERIDR